MGKILRKKGLLTRRIPLNFANFPFSFRIISSLYRAHPSKGKVLLSQSFHRRHRTLRFADEKEHIGHRQYQLIEMSRDISQSTVLYYLLFTFFKSTTDENCDDLIHPLSLTCWPNLFSFSASGKKNNQSN